MLLSIQGNAETSLTLIMILGFSNMIVFSTRNFTPGMFMTSHNPVTRILLSSVRCFPYRE